MDHICTLSCQHSDMAITQYVSVQSNEARRTWKQRRRWGCVGGERCSFRRTARGAPTGVQRPAGDSEWATWTWEGAPTQGTELSTQILKWEPASRVQGKANAPTWQEQSKQAMRAERKWGAAKRTVSDWPVGSLEGFEQSAMNLHILTRSLGLLGWE